MDATERDLRAAILAAPDDLAPRLVYADWLSERGDPRGEHIVLQCAEGREDEARELRRRALWQRYGATWLAEDLESTATTICATRSSPWRSGSRLARIAERRRESALGAWRERDHRARTAAVLAHARQ